MKKTGIIGDGLLLHHDAATALTRYNENPVHAVILEGPHGIGKSMLAKQVAAALLGIPEAKVDTHPYIVRLTVEKQAIPIEQVRALHGFFARKVPGKALLNRVVLIPDADLLTIPAQNALLKLLEEPPSDSSFILTSSVPHKLLPTIRSRLQRIHIPAPSDDAIVSYLSSQYETSAIKKALLLSGRNIASIMSVLQNEANEPMLPLVRALLAGDAYERLVQLQPFMKEREESRQFIEMLLGVATASLQSAADQGSSTVSRWRHVEQAAYIAADALQKNGNPKLVLTELAMHL